jgi:hypothetical protein
MKRHHFALTVLIIGCSTEKPADKNFPDLTRAEKMELFKQFGDELKGDFLIYSGQVQFEDTTGMQGPPTFLELVMDKDNRFAIRAKFIESESKTDSMTFSFQGGSSNKGMGKWADLGEKFKLKFELGTVDSFFEEPYAETINIIDNYTLEFDKSVEELVIWRTRCRRLSE